MILFLHGAMQDHLGGPYGGDGSFAGGVGPGEIEPNALIVTPLGRGQTPLGYDGPSEQDVFDVLADATARFHVDTDRIVLSGYSLGGVGTFRFAQLYPDRWAGAVDFVGADDLGALTALEEAQGGQTMPNQLENLRNLPFRMAHSRLDELEIIVGAVQPDRAALELQRLGYDFRYWQFYRREHLTFPVRNLQCEMEAAIARRRVVNPARVTYSQEPAIQLRHDRAYWMSDMVVRGADFGPGDKGTVDITSLARPDRSFDAAPVVGGGENISAGRDVCGDNPAVTTGDVWSTLGQKLTPAAPQPVSNAIEGSLTRVASATLDLGRMDLDRSRAIEVRVTSDGAGVLRLRGGWTRRVLVGDRSVCPRAGAVDVPVGAPIVVTPTDRRC
jgi:pimeloyl-ACP methyl ester carboxylesterase